uniref:Lipocalin/cytosolic fatty-acid binding domain-containing protein n=1 Tax=Amblyomma maculatum TaxID=34609 RepID=G3MPF8_AMBMU
MCEYYFRSCLMSNMRAAILVSIFALASASYDYKGRPTIDDVVKFFETEENIWLRTRSYSRRIENSEPRCIFFKRLLVTEKELKLRTSFSFGSTTTSTHLTAKLSRGRGLDDAPVIEDNTRGQKRRYSFQYFNEEEKCAVITFSDPEWNLKCELHVWQQEVKASSLPNCEREFDDLCLGRPKYKVFHDTCSLT